MRLEQEEFASLRLNRLPVTGSNSFRFTFLLATPVFAFLPQCFVLRDSIRCFSIYADECVCLFALCSVWCCCHWCCMSTEASSTQGYRHTLVEAQQWERRQDWMRRRHSRQQQPHVRKEKWMRAPSTSSRGCSASIVGSHSVRTFQLHRLFVCRSHDAKQSVRMTVNSTCRYTHATRGVEGKRGRTTEPNECRTWFTVWKSLESEVQVGDRVRAGESLRFVRCARGKMNENYVFDFVVFFFFFFFSWPCAGGDAGEW